MPESRNSRILDTGRHTGINVNLSLLGFYDPFVLHLQTIQSAMRSEREVLYKYKIHRDPDTEYQDKHDHIPEYQKADGSGQKTVDTQKAVHPCPGR